MILDSQALYTSNQAVTAVGDTPSVNSMDHGPGNPGPGLAGQWLAINVDSTFTSGGAGTLQAVLQDSANNTAWADLMALTPALPLSALTAKKVLVQARYPGNIRRYTRIVWRVAGAAMTAGAVSARVTMSVDAQQLFPSGFAVG
jgi:ferric-dicitrate binding protein FerR (iron transport regulator)